MFVLGPEKIKTAELTLLLPLYLVLIKNIFCHFKNSNVFPFATLHHGKGHNYHKNCLKLQDDDAEE